MQVFAGPCGKENKAKGAGVGQPHRQVCLEESLSPSGPSTGVAGFIRGYSSWEIPNIKAHHHTRPGRRGRKTPAKDQPLAGLLLPGRGEGRGLG